MGPAFGIVAAVLICLVVAGSLLGNSFVAGRMVVAAANLNWLPRFLGFIGHLGIASKSEPITNSDSALGDASDSFSGAASTNKSDAPINAIILSTILSTLYILLGNFRALLTFNGLGEYSFFFLTVVGAIVLRFRDPGLHRPYKPLILIPAIFAVVSGFVVIRGAVFAPLQAAVLIVLWTLGVAFYWVRRRWAAHRVRGD
jgi:L-type amino acid transporter 9